MKTLWQHCHVASMAQGVYSIIEDAAILTSGERIEWIGPRQSLPVTADARVVELNGAWVTPGLIDCQRSATPAGLVARWRDHRRNQVRVWPGPGQ